MKLHVFSDLHFEHQSKEQSRSFWERWATFCEDEAEKGAVCVLAGDIDTLRPGLSGVPPLEYSLQEFTLRYKSVVYVAGNHEFWGVGLNNGLISLENIRSDLNAHSNHDLTYGSLYCLNGKMNAYAIQGENHQTGFFTGETLWYPNPQNDHLCSQFSDFFKIKDAYPEVFLQNAQFVRDILPKINSDHVVITHHMPLNECVSPRYAGSEINCFFANDLFGYLNEGNCPKLWIFGHTHDPIDFTLKFGNRSTRFYCNPKGYPSEWRNNPDFWSRVSIDV